jgi:hypothetical protein
MFPQYGHETLAYSKRLWFKIIIQRHDPNMVLENNVSISIMFCVMFRRFDILVVSKNMVLTCFYHVSITFHTGFLQVFYMFLKDYVHASFMFFSCLSKVHFPTLYNKFLQKNFL